MTTRGVIRALPWLGSGNMPMAVSMEDAKSHLRVDHADDDLMIGAYLMAAIEGLDGPGSLLNRGLITQAFACDLPCFPCGQIDLPMCSVTEVTTIKYLDSDGVSQTVPDTVWQLVTDNRFTAYLALKAGQVWPDTFGQDAAVSIEFKSGFGDTADDVPFPIKAAILLRTADLYKNREQTGDRQSYENPSYATLIASYRKLSV